MSGNLGRRRVVILNRMGCEGLPEKRNFSKGLKEVKERIMQGWVWWLTPVIPTLWEAEAGESPEFRSLRGAWPTWQNPISTKNTKISRAWWRVSVIPATWEAEAGELLEPGRWRLQ